MFCYFLLFSAIFCYSGHLDFLVRLEEVLFCATFCYFLLFSAILGSSATPNFFFFFFSHFQKVLLTINRTLVPSGGPVVFSLQYFMCIFFYEK